MINDKQLSLADGRHIRWDETVAVSAYAVDAIQRLVIYLVFDHECGDYIEVTDSDSEYSELLAALDQHLEITPDWRKQVSLLRPDKDPVVLFTR